MYIPGKREAERLVVEDPALNIMWSWELFSMDDYAPV